MAKDLVKHNINFLEYPLWFQDSRLADNTKDGMTWADREGYVYRAGYKTPVKTDAIFLLYLLLQSQLSNYSEVLTLSRYQILQECGFGVDAGSYSRLEDSLERWKMVGVKFSGTFYDGNNYKAINFGIIDSWEIRKDNKLLQIWFSPRFLEMMRGNGFFKYVKFSEFKQLRSSLATRLYEILSKSFHSSDIFNINVIKLAEKIPMAERYPAHIIPKIKSAVTRINKSTKTQFELTIKRSENEKNNIILCFRKLEAQNPPLIIQQNNKKHFQIPTTEEFNSIIKALPAVRQSQNTILKIIVAFYEINGCDYVLRNIDYTNKHAKNNYRSYLLKALQNDYGLAMKEDEDIQQKIIAQQKLEKQKIEQQKAAEQERLRIEQENKKRVKEYIASLPEEEKLNLKAQALADMSETNKAIVLKNGTGAKSLLNIEIEKIALKKLNDSKSTEAILTTFS